MRNLFLAVCVLGGLSATATEVRLSYQCKPTSIQLYAADDKYAFIHTFNFDDASSKDLTAEGDTLEIAQKNAMQISRDRFQNTKLSHPEFNAFSVGAIDCRMKAMLDETNPDLNLYSPTTVYPHTSKSFLDGERASVERGGGRS